MWCKINEMPIVAIDCEMVGILKPKPSCNRNTVKDNMLARVSIVDFFGNILYDTLVAPQQPVKNYRTEITGLREEHFICAPSFAEVTNTVSSILAGKIIVGHGLENDLAALKFFYPKKYLRDTANYNMFRYYNNGKAPSLKELAKEHLNLEVQNKNHDSIEDALAALEIYKKFQQPWENEIALKNMN